jgi:glycerol-3-phosphate dehydrogenase
MARHDEQDLSTEFDLLIVGGGITGCGAARDAARRGLRVALIDQGDLASGTSSRSSKLVHGGLRYLEQGEFSLVFEAVTERRNLQEIAPHLVNPLPFLFPVYRTSRRGVFTVNVGMWLYDGLSLFRSPKRHENLSVKQVKKVEPLLRTDGLKGAPLYYDCGTDDARLTLETALDAAAHGAVLATYTQVTGFTRAPNGRINGVDVESRLTGARQKVRALVVINATGPWSDRTRAIGGGDHAPRLRPTKGIHIVVAADRLDVRHAVVAFHPTDGRVLFAIPWGDRTYIGTTDTDFTGDPDEVRADKDDVEYLLNVTNHYFPSVKLTIDDVIATWAGVRPLIGEDEGGSESNVSREHDIRVDSDGLITVAGGKLTTYRRMGAEVVDKALDLLRMTGRVPAELHPAHTDREPLPGAVGWPENDDHDAVARQVEAAGQGAIDARTARLLGDTYGMRGLDVAELAASDAALAEPLIEGRPEIAAQVVYAAERELAATVADVLIRRTQIFFRDWEQGVGVADKVAALMADRLGWDEARVQSEVEAYRTLVEWSRHWRTA